MFIDRSYPAYEIASKGLPLYATGFVFFAINIVSIGYFQSVERARYATIITLLRGFVLLTACFFGLPLLFGNPGIWLATPLAELLTTLFILIIYIKAKRERKKIYYLCHMETMIKKFCQRYRLPEKACMNFCHT